ncbi:MAG: glycosyltransferase family 2 protein [Chloroflexi bacterium]|nr:glycosyltransferase family 2 protein [Chloroflexota bacterium]
MPKKPASTSPTLAVVVPVFNEQAALPAFHARLTGVLESLPNAWRLLYVDDGSVDETPHLLQALSAADERVRVLHLSRNFGHQAALTAGLDHADTELVITLDGDGQHPPELIPEMLRLHSAGYDIVQTQRLNTAGTSAFKRWTAGGFYTFLNRISDTHVEPGAADFRLLSRAAADGLRQMREHHRFLRGMVSWMGFRTVILPYQPAERMAGTSKYSLRKMVRLALDAAFSFSLAPLWIGMSVGVVFFLLAIAEAAYVLSFWLRGEAGALAPGWSSLMFMLLIVGGVLTTLLGFIGVYVGYIFQEAKGRPIYLTRPGPPPPPA